MRRNSEIKINVSELGFKVPFSHLYICQASRSQLQSSKCEQKTGILLKSRIQHTTPLQFYHV